MGSRRCRTLAASRTEAHLTSELRRSVLRPNWPIGSVMIGDDQDDVVHLACFDGDRPISACVIFAEACPWEVAVTAWRLRSMATDPTARRTGAGGLVLGLAHEVAANAGAELIWCLARETAVPFYAAYGWTGHGDLFDVPDIGPHLQMARPLP